MHASLQLQRFHALRNKETYQRGKSIKKQQLYSTEVKQELHKKNKKNRNTLFDIQM